MADAPNSLTDDLLLRTFDTLPAHFLLTTPQVALVLQSTTRWLEEQRSRGNPPPYVELGGRMVRYGVGPLRDYIHALFAEAPASPTAARAQREATELGFDEPILRGGRRKKPAQGTFNAFLTQGQLDDEWPFVRVGDFCRPVDFLEALLKVEADDVRDAGWLTLGGYLAAMRDSAEREATHHRAAAEVSRLDGHLPNAPASVPTCDRCGKALVSGERHRCRL
jgi:hypothetical protein